MPERDTYMLRIYRSRAVSGWQWAARLDALPEGESRRFSDPEVLLAYLRTTIYAGACRPLPVEMLSGATDPALTAEEPGTSRADEQGHTGEGDSACNGAPQTPYTAASSEASAPPAGQAPPTGTT